MKRNLLLISVLLIAGIAAANTATNNANQKPVVNAQQVIREKAKNLPNVFNFRDHHLTETDFYRAAKAACAASNTYGKRPAQQVVAAKAETAGFAYRLDSITGVGLRRISDGEVENGIIRFNYYANSFDAELVFVNLENDTIINYLCQFTDFNENGGFELLVNARNEEGLEPVAKVHMLKFNVQLDATKPVKVYEINIPMSSGEIDMWYELYEDGKWSTDDTERYIGTFDGERLTYEQQRYSTLLKEWLSEYYGYAIVEDGVAKELVMYENDLEIYPNGVMIRIDEHDIMGFDEKGREIWDKEERLCDNGEWITTWYKEYEYIGYEDYTKVREESKNSYDECAAGGTTRREEYTYDDKGNELTYIESERNSVDEEWEPNYKNERSYYENGNRKDIVYYYYTNGEWTLSTKEEFNENNKQTLRADYENGVEKIRSTWTYYEDLNTQTRRRYEYNEGELILREVDSVLIVRNDNGGTTEYNLLHEYYDANGNLSGEQYTITYYTNLKRESETRAYYDDNILSYQYTYKYDEQGREVYQENINSENIVTNKREKIYDEDGGYTEKQYSYNDEQLLPSYTYTYNAKGIQIEHIDYQNGEPQYKYVYDSGVDTEHYKWSKLDNDWLLTYKEGIGDMNSESTQNSSYYDNESESYINGTYINLTRVDENFGTTLTKERYEYFIGEDGEFIHVYNHETNTYEYDAETNLPTTCLEQRYNSVTKEMENYEKSTFALDGHILTKTHTEEWNNTTEQWEEPSNELKEYYYYNNNKLEYIGYAEAYGNGYGGNGWIDSLSFDENSNLTSRIRYNEFDGTNFYNPQYKYEYTIDEDGITSQIYYTWDEYNDPQWQISGNRHDYKYDAMGRTLYEVYYHWDGENWQPSSEKRIYAYDDNGNHILDETYNSSDDGNWYPNHKYKYAYDDHNRQTLNETYYGNGLEWQADYKYEHITDENGHTIMSAHYDTEGDHFVPREQNYYIYNENGNQIGRTYYRNWNGSSFNSFDTDGGKTIKYIFIGDYNIGRTYYSWNDAEKDWTGEIKYSGNNSYYSRQDDELGRTIEYIEFWDIEYDAENDTIKSLRGEKREYTYEGTSQDEATVMEYTWDSELQEWVCDGGYIRYTLWLEAIEGIDIENELFVSLDENNQILGTLPFNDDDIIDCETGEINLEGIHFDYDEQVDHNTVFGLLHYWNTGLVFNNLLSEITYQGMKIQFHYSEPEEGELPTATENINGGTLQVAASNGMLTLTAAETQTISLFNAAGQLIDSRTMRACETQTYYLPTGCYLLQSTDDTVKVVL